MQKAGGVGRVQDCSDVNVTLGAGVDGYSITYDHASGKFVLSAVSGVGISKIQDADDVNFSLGVGVDGYTVNYDHDTGKFVLTAPVVPGPSGISEIQDADDVNVSLGAGVDEYALCYDHDTAKFVLRQIVGAYIACSGSVAGQNMTGGLTMTTLDDVSSHGLIIHHGKAAGSVTWQNLITLYDYADNVQFQIKTRSFDGGTMMLVPSINTSPPLDLRGVGILSSTGAAQVIQTKSILLESYYSADLSSAVSGTIYGGKDASDSLKLESTFNATKGYVLINAVGGNCGIGNSAPGTPLDINLPSAVTNAVSNVLTVRHASSGTPAAGFGVALIFGLESTTTENQSAGRVYAVWAEATHATRKAQVVFTAYDTAEREGIRIGANGSAATLGLLGATPSTQLAHVADASTAHAVTDPADSPADADALREDLVTNVIPSVETQLNNLGTKINSILTTLETFGFHATS